MKKFGIILGLFVPCLIFAQPRLAYLMTSKDIYLNTEAIRFTAPFQSTMESGVFGYVELLDTQGIAISQAIFPADRHKLAGGLNIPLNIRSGPYLLTAYTYSSNRLFRPVWILNPNIKPEATYMDNPGIADQSSEVSFLIENLASREIIPFRIQAHHPSTTYYSISVYRDIAQVNDKNISWDTEATDSFVEDYNMRIGGRLLDARAADVVLSSIGQNPQVWSIKTTEMGYFNQLIPRYSGTRDWNISFPDSHSTEQFTWSIGFEKPDALPEHRDLIVVGDSSTLYNYIQQCQIEHEYDQFHQDSLITHTEYNDYPFYGIADRTYWFGDYVPMDLRDFIFEIVKEIKIVRQGKERTIRVENPELNGLYEGEPLVMLDGLMITDHAWILAKNSGLFESIRVVSQPYLIAGKLWDGIVHFTSVNRDGMDISIPDNQKRITIPGQRNYLKKWVDTGSNWSKDSRMPYFVTNPYWNDYAIPKNGVYEDSFRAPDAKGVYTLKAIGFNSDEEVITVYRKTFEIR